ncbi:MULTISPECIES: hypothetical protein [Paraburkholderia]|uniref:hypothetical protein n=1 Tax=Paraburkholderia TaxID=1822464 RepID=UPI0002553946|nr:MULTISPECIES: hypothetical protein [Paraburkholderia]MDR8398806.1 hypothetical protein [Paraburkholderia sp. USG1]
MDFNLCGDAARAAKRCCSEMATGYARRPSAKRPALRGTAVSEARARQTLRAAFWLPASAAGLDGGGFFACRLQRAATTRGRAQAAGTAFDGAQCT